MAAKLMHAVQYNSYGGGPSGLKHVEIPIPTPKKDEVLLKLEAASINPVDWTVQSGLMRPFFPTSFPHTPVSDVAGEVVEVGQDVRKFKVGDKVVAFLTLANGGGFAEFATARESATALRPSEVSAAEAAALPVAAITALKCLTEVAGIKIDGTGPAKNILITGASGGVGHFAVQLAKLGNHHVTATCGARNFDFVKILGADEVLDYKTPEGASLKSPSDRKYDVIVDCTAGIAWSIMKRNLSPNGTAVVITFGPKVMMTYLLQKVMCNKKRLVPLMTFRKAHYLEYLVELIKEGKLKVVFDSRYPLSKAEEAWAKSISGHATGKIVVEA